MIGNLKTQINKHKDSKKLHWRALFYVKRGIGSQLRESSKNRDMTAVHLFPEQKIIYVEIPKAGCSSIKRALKEYRGLNDDNDKIPDIHKVFGYSYVPSSELPKVLKHQYADWTKFTVVRDPYSRFRSLFYDKIRKEDPEVSLDETLKDFKKNKWFADNHGKPQYRLLGNDISVFDFVGRTEDMGTVFAFLSKSFKKHIKELHTHVKGAKIKEPLNEGQKSEIHKIYKHDFKLLGYEK